MRFLEQDDFRRKCDVNNIMIEKWMATGIAVEIVIWIVHFLIQNNIIIRFTCLCTNLVIYRSIYLVSFSLYMLRFLAKCRKQKEYNGL